MSLRPYLIYYNVKLSQLSKSPILKENIAISTIKDFNLQTLLSNFLPRLYNVEHFQLQWHEHEWLTTFISVEMCCSLKSYLQTCNRSAKNKTLSHTLNLDPSLAVFRFIFLSTDLKYACQVLASSFSLVLSSSSCKHHTKWTCIGLKCRLFPQLKAVQKQECDLLSRLCGNVSVKHISSRF